MSLIRYVSEMFKKKNSDIPKIRANANKEVGGLVTTLKFDFLCMVGVQSAQTFLVNGLVFGLEENDIYIWRLRQVWREKHVRPAVVSENCLSLQLLSNITLLYVS